jgi:hypothetical protein
MRSIFVAMLLSCALCSAQTASNPGANARKTTAPQPQSPTATGATVSGTVTDSSGAIIIGATVVLSNAAGSTAKTSTNAEGKFVVHGLAPGSYTVTITAPNFAEYSSVGLNVKAGPDNDLEAQLQPAGEKTQVDVTAQSFAQVETEKAELAGTISEEQVVTFALNGRNFSQLLTLAAGVSDQTGQDEAKVGVVGSAKYSVNGGRVEYNTFDVDGGDVLNTSIAASRGHSTLTVYPSLDAIEEMKVLTSNYGAQYGRSASGTFLVTTKSGGQNYHGNAYEFVRNEMFNARGFKDPVGHAPLYRRNDLGATFGGPIYIPNKYNTKKDKSFFFYSEELRLERSPSTFSQAVPSLNERDGNFSDVCPAGGGTFDRAKFPDCPSPTPQSARGGTTAGYLTYPQNIIPIDANARAVLNTNLVPLANSPSGCTFRLNAGAVTNDPASWPCYNATVSPNTYWREELFRIDHNFTSEQKVSFRFIHDAWNTTTTAPEWQYGGVQNSFPTVLNKFVGPGLNLVAHVTTVHLPSLVNDYSMSFSNDHISLTSQPGPGATLTRPSVLDANCGSTLASCGMGYIFQTNTDKIPAIIYGGSNAAYGGSGFIVDTSYMPWKHSAPTITLRDDLSKVIGKHTLQVGVMFIDSQQSEISSATGANTGNVQGLLTFSNVSNSSSSGNTFADSLLTIPGSTNGTILYYQQDSAQHVYSNHYSVVEPYLQDDWKVSPHLVLNLGFRLSIFGNWTPDGTTVYNFVPGQFSSSLAQSIQVNSLYGYIEDAGTGSAVLANPSSPAAATTNGLVQCSVNGVPASCMSSHLYNSAPRFGFAWDPSGTGEISVRGGYGVFFEHGTGDEANVGSLTGSAPMVQSMTQNSPQGSQFSWECIGGRGVGCSSTTPAGAAYPLDVVAIPTKAIWPYVQQWSVSVQRSLSKNSVATVAYVGSKGTHLTTVRQLNQFDPVSPEDNFFGPHEPIFYAASATETGVCYIPSNGPQSYTTQNGYRYWPGSAAYFNLEVACSSNVNVNAFRRYPGFGRILSIENIANSDYNALQITLRHSHGPLNVAVSYGYGHSIDEASDRFESAFGNSLNPRSNRASSDFDQRNNLNISYVYRLPFVKWLQVVQDNLYCHDDGEPDDAECRQKHPVGVAPPHFLQAALANWELSGITLFQNGTPFSVINGGSSLVSVTDNAGVANGLGAGSYADVVHDKPCPSAFGDTSAIGPSLGNPCRFVAPRGLTFGDSGRNYLNNPLRLNFDIALRRQFVLTQESHLEVRAEAFNLFNNTQFRIFDPEKGNTASNTITCYGGVADSYSAGASSCQTGNAFLHPVDAHRPRTMQFGVKLAF